MQISITNTFKISVGEHEIILSMFDAEKLYQELGRALGKNSTIIASFRDAPDFSLQNKRMENKS